MAFVTGLERENIIRERAVFRWKGLSDADQTIQLRDNNDKLVLEVRKDGSIILETGNASAGITALTGSTGVLKVVKRSGALATLDVLALRINTTNAGIVGGIAMEEIATPGVAPTNTAHLYVKDAGGGKSALAVIFQSGSEIIIETEL